MDEEQRKRTTRTTLNQLEEERIFPVLEMIESDLEVDTSSDSDEDFECSDDHEEFFYGGGAIQSGLDSSEDDIEYDDDDYDLSQDMEEDDVDPDLLSYEELLALGEMVGVENTGLSEAEITTHLHPLTCHSTTSLLIDRCVICQVEYEQGEELVTLKCDHLYHKDCISKWLQIKKICPICNNEVSRLGLSNTDSSIKKK
ncbi:hypothetical protein CASFOL_023236 [Castilleja foliolosa]|uniref:RING-type domain-containing protein n=1 Tax=Castilleja foliolosa TaxID=1961234 RepID=A0ABD3CKZ2_9LAMI